MTNWSREGKYEMGEEVNGLTIISARWFRFDENWNPRWFTWYQSRYARLNFDKKKNPFPWRFSWTLERVEKYLLSPFFLEVCVSILVVTLNRTHELPGLKANHSQKFFTVGLLPYWMNRVRDRVLSVSIRLNFLLQ